MKRRLAAAFLALSAWSSGGAAAKLAPDSELGVYRFYPSHDANSAAVAAYKLENGLFVPKQLGRLSATSTDSDDCQILLNHLQSFPLRVMKQVEYLAADEFFKQMAVIKALVPEQVTFLEMTVPVPTLAVRADPTMYPAHLISPRPDEHRPDHTHVRQATMWVISGQSMYPFSYEDHRIQHPKSHPVPLTFKTERPEAARTEAAQADPHTIILNLTGLPWQMEPSLWISGKMKRNEMGYADLSREKYPIVYEFGRAAQVEPEQMDPLFRAAMTVVQDDLATSLQADAEQTYIFVKAFDESRIRRFRRVGFQPVDGLCDRHGGLMVAPYLELAKRFPPGSHSGRIEEIREAFRKNPDINYDDALNFLRRTQTYFRAELDFIVKPFGLIQKTPLVINDLSANYFTLLTAWLEFHGGNSRDEAHRLARKFSRFRHDNTTNRYIEDVIPVEHFADDLTRRNAVRITNLDPELNKNPNYLPLVLIGIHQYMVERYAEMNISNGEQILDHHKTVFVLQTTHLDVATRALNLGGIADRVHAGADGRALYGVQFSLEQVRVLAKQNPKWVEAGAEGVAQGRWFFRSLTGSPLKF